MYTTQTSGAKVQKKTKADN